MQSFLPLSVTNLGFIFQDANLLDSLTARENIMALTNHWSCSCSGSFWARRKRCQAAPDSEVLDRSSQMSGGQRQRVAAARAIVANPSVLADELTGRLTQRISHTLPAREPQP